MVPYTKIQYSLMHYKAVKVTCNVAIPAAMEKKMHRNICIGCLLADVAHRQSVLVAKKT